MTDPTSATVRAAADEPVDVRLTVNGTPVTVRVPARVTLADALRDQLGLSGTHLGCEHGVCGMCTVLVDGAAARSCLLFTVQCSGAEIVTVEGLGTPDHQHPLQRAFSHHHALQCGFCTPGFLLTSYDLLTHQPDVPAETLPEELSGVLCRCTGYRNILTAVADVAATYPDGVPAPHGCHAQALVGRRNTAPGARLTQQPAEQPTMSAPAEIALPSGAPSASVEVTSTVSAPIDKVWATLGDVNTLARCLPGAELTEALDGDRYRGRARISLGPMRLCFEGVAHILEREPSQHRLHALAQGTDTGGSSTKADIRLRAHRAGTATTLHAHAEVYLSGRIAQFGRALAGDVSRRLFEQFADAVEETVTTGTAPQRRHRASALRLLASTVVARVRAAIDRLRRR